MHGVIPPLPHTSSGCASTQGLRFLALSYSSVMRNRCSVAHRCAAEAI
jgi:hypothetical protein